MIPSEQIIELVRRGLRVHVLVEPRVGHETDWTALSAAINAARHDAKCDMPVDKHVEKLNELLECHSVVRVSDKPFRPGFGEETWAI